MRCFKKTAKCLYVCIIIIIFVNRKKYHHYDFSVPELINS